MAITKTTHFSPGSIGVTVFHYDNDPDTGSHEGGFVLTGYYLWLFVYIDPAGNYSEIKLVGCGLVSALDHVVFHCVPSAYSGEIDRLEIYRSEKFNFADAIPIGDIVDGNEYVVLSSNFNTAGYITYPSSGLDTINYRHGQRFTGGSDADYVDNGGGTVFVFDYPSFFGYIGKVESADEGVFVDDYIPLGKPFKSVGGEYNYESDIRWSEPYRPHQIRLENVASFRLGDGKQITGLQVLYGNLVVFKETSIGRYAVQASEVPISRVDEVSNEIGCIAPNTLIQVANTLYFLSWKGLMKYDNNQLSKVDGHFDEELQFRLRNAQLFEIRKASCGYNNTYNELYLNFPYTGELDGNSAFEGETNSFGTQRTVRGHIYVVSLDKGYATKYAYQDYPIVGQLPEDLPNDGTVVARDAFSHARIYHTNSLGELRSAEVGEHYAVWASDPPSGTPAKIPAGIFIDAPTEIDEDWIFDVPLFIDTDNVINLTPDYTDFDGLPIQNLWRSKHFTGNKEHNIKRVRKVSINKWQRTGNSSVTVHAVPFASTDDRIDEDGYVTTELFGNPSNNIITVVPDSEPDGVEAWINDEYGKPVRVWVQYEGVNRTHLNAVSIWWRPIHPYLP